jgi:Kelch motif
MVPRMAVAGYFYFDGKTRLGVVTDWNWAMKQWDAVAAAGVAVRLVVVDWSYAYKMPPSASGPNTPNAPDVKTRLTACRNAGQLIFGYVAGSGGAIPQDPPPPNNVGTWWIAPRDNNGFLTGNPVPAAVDATGALPCIREQVDTWQSTYPGLIDGIYVDEGPVDCLVPNSAAAAIPGNYANYCGYIRQHGWQVFLLAPLYDDNDPNAPGWLQNLNPDYLGLWEGPLGRYETAYNSYNACAQSWTPWPNAASKWWLTDDLSQRQSRVHIVNDGIVAEAQANHETNAQVLTKVRGLALSRGAATMWITEAPVDPVLGSVYGMLPPYWDDEVALFTGGPPPQGWSLQHPASSPPARFGACMAYDEACANVVLFGGESTQAGYSDTWVWDGNDWVQLTPTSNPPGVVYGHMAYDRTRNVVVLWGGEGAGGIYPIETWIWDGANWSRLTPAASPPGRSNGMMAWDGSRIILYGGETNNVRRADMWAWDGQNWTELSQAAAPGIRVGATMTFDPASHRTVLQGGSSDKQMLSDTWLWDGTAWMQEHPPADPGSRVDAAAASDGTQALVFGGAQSAAVPLLADLWGWNGTNWAVVPGGGPSPRTLAVLAQHPSGTGIVLFGGDDAVNKQTLGDTWTWSPAPRPGCFGWSRRGRRGWHEHRGAR